MKPNVILNIGIIILFVHCGQSPKISCKQFNNFENNVKNEKMDHDSIFLLKKINEIIQEDSLCVDAYLTRANLYFDLDSLNLALLDYKKVLIFDSTNIYSLYRTGLVYQELEKDDLALSFFQKAVEHKMFQNTIITYSNDGVMSKNDKTKYDVQSEMLIYAQGLSYYYIRKLDSALIKFNFCIANKYYLKESFLRRGIIYWEMSQDHKACDDFIESRKLGSNRAAELISKYCNVK